MDAKQKALIEDYARVFNSVGGHAWESAEGHALLAALAPPTIAAPGSVIGWWDAASASGFRWRAGVVRADFEDGTPIYLGGRPPAAEAIPAWGVADDGRILSDSARDSAWHAIPMLPPAELLDYYGDQYSVPVLLRSGEEIVSTVARWCFAEDGWVNANFTEGASPRDYEFLNAKAQRWRLLSDALDLPATYTMDDKETNAKRAGVWVHCSPALINAGLPCGETPRRECACAVNGSHDHWISFSGVAGVPDGYHLIPEERTPELISEIRAVEWPATYSDSIYREGDGALRAETIRRIALGARRHVAILDAVPPVALAFEDGSPDPVRFNGAAIERFAKGVANAREERLALEKNVVAALTVQFAPLSEGLPDPLEHDRVIVFTDGVDFAGEQFFDVKADTLNAANYDGAVDQPEVSRHATHWAARPGGAALVATNGVGGIGATCPTER